MEVVPWILWLLTAGLAAVAMHRADRAQRALDEVRRVVVAIQHRIVALEHIAAPAAEAARADIQMLGADTLQRAIDPPIPLPANELRPAATAPPAPSPLTPVTPVVADAPPVAETPLTPVLPDPQPADAAPSLPPAFAPAPAAPHTGSLGRFLNAEQRISSILYIAVGALAVVLAGWFLVRYSIEQGLLSPTVRVILAALLGAAALVTGEALRSRSAGVARALVAAGVAILYGALYSACRLYEMVSPGGGAALGIALTALAIGLSLRHGQPVAWLGLVGGSIMPVIVGTGQPNEPMLFGYLALLSFGVLALLRMRGWWALGYGVLAVAVFWVAIWRIELDLAATRPYRGGFAAAYLLAVAAGFVVAEWRRLTSDNGVPPLAGLLLPVALATTAALMLLVLAGHEQAPVTWLCLAGLGLACMALARLQPGRQWLALIGPAASLLGVIQWWARVGLGAPGVPAAAAGYLPTAIVFGCLWAIAALACLRGAARPSFWAALSGAAAIAFALAVVAALDRDDRLVGGLVLLVIAAAYAAAAFAIARQRTSGTKGEEGLDDAVGIVAVTAAGFVALCFALLFGRQWLTIALALELAAVAWIASRFGLAMLRHACTAIAAVVAVRLLLNPAIFSYPLEPIPIVNWILYTYGIAAGAFWVASHCLKLAREDALTTALDIGILAFGFALLSLEVHSLFHPTDLAATQVSFLERAWLGVVWSSFALALLVLHRLSPRPVLAWAWYVAASLATLLVVGGGVLVANPLVVAADVGGLPIVNGLIPAYGVPALIALACAGIAVRIGDRPAALAALACAVVLAFVFVSLEIRHLFGRALDRPLADMGAAELYSYSAVWLTFGAVLLVIGIIRRMDVLRYASALVLAVTVAKVFVIDTSGLPDLWRVVSFLGLGMVLLGLGYLYSRHFRRIRAAGGPAAAEGVS
jgi:uncharacterized membrane protein